MWKVSISLVEPKFDFKISVLYGKKQLKLVADSYPAVAKKTEILDRGFNLNCVPVLN